MSLSLSSLPSQLSWALQSSLPSLFLYPSQIHLSNSRSRNYSQSSSSKDSFLLKSPLDYKVPKGSIVLCHGLFGFDTFGPSQIPFLQFHYWRGISEALTALGCKVFISKVGTVSSVEVRSQQLYSQLERILANDKDKEMTINLVGHSS